MFPRSAVLRRSPIPRRNRPARFQFGLTSAVAMMLAAGGVLYLTFFCSGTCSYQRTERYGCDMTNYIGELDPLYFTEFAWYNRRYVGWPCKYAEIVRVVKSDGSRWVDVDEKDVTFSPGIERRHLSLTPIELCINVLIDLAAAFTIIFSSGLAAECFARECAPRCEARKQDQLAVQRRSRERC
ncbi:MAG: hypothetical protein HY291_13495 [Planctomycetes bacterium]|nr:hypothetical protein [Planctomycetota bacterium]